MTCCRALLRSSAGEACWRSESFSIAHNLYKRRCCVIFAFSIATHIRALERSSTPRWAPCLWPSSWACSFHAVPSLQGRYISAERTEACACTYQEVTVCSAFGEPEIPPADNDTALDDDESLGEVEVVKKVENFLVVNFYVLVDIDDPQKEVARHTAFMENKDIHGRILISSQGINAQYSGPSHDVMAYANWVKEDPRFSSLYVQVSPAVNGHAFPRFRLRHKPSLVQVEGGTENLPITDSASRALPLSPREWKDKLASAQRSHNVEASSGLEEDDASCKLMQRPVLLLDVRNGYEWDVGHFKNAQRPPVDCFKSTEFGLQYDEDKQNDPLANVDKENTDILMYCTGGIRCDVYSTVLRQKGFKHLYSLQGGIARYLIEENGENWLGNLFVFDSRLSVPPPAYKQCSDHPEADTEHAKNSQGEVHTEDRYEFSVCSLCGGPLSHMRHRNCANLDCNRLFLCCDQCVSELAGCCSTQCTAAPRQRPYSSTPQQYKRWYNYRDQCLPATRPAGYVGKRAKRRLLDSEKKQDPQNNASVTATEDRKGLLQEYEGNLHICVDSL